MNKKYYKIKFYLKLDDKSDLRAAVGMWFIMLLFFFPLAIGGIEIFQLKESFLSVKVLSISIIDGILGGWGIIIYIFVDKLKKQAVLFIGLSAFFSSIISLILYYDLLYKLYKISDMLPAILGIFLYIFIGVFWSYYIVNGVNNGSLNPKQNKSKPKYNIIAIFSVLGMLIAKLNANKVGGNMEMVLFPLSFLVISYAFLLVSHYLYKYYLICKYKDDMEKDKKQNAKLDLNIL